MELFWRETAQAGALLKPTWLSQDGDWMIVQRDWQWSVHKRNEHDVFALVKYCDSLQKAKQYAQQLASE